MRLIFYQLSTNVNYPAHMSIHHSQTLMCQKRGGGGLLSLPGPRVRVSDVRAKRLSFTPAINYTNNIHSMRIYFNKMEKKGGIHGAEQTGSDRSVTADSKSTRHADRKHIISSPFFHIGAFDWIHSGP